MACINKIKISETRLFVYNIEVDIFTIVAIEKSQLKPI